VVTQCREIAGVTAVKVDPVSNRLIVRFDPGRTDRQRVLSAIETVVDRVH
jgi:copper chaperone CopZ